MKQVTLSLTLVLLTFIAVAIIRHKTVDDNIISYTVDPKVQDIRFYWKDDNGIVLSSIDHLKQYLTKKKHRKLIFATNGGMFKPDQSPVGRARILTSTILRTTSNA